MSSTRFNPARPHQGFVSHWTGLARRGELGNIPIARAYRKPLAAELDKLGRGESHDQGARARAILWNGYGSRFIEHLGFRMGASAIHKKMSESYQGAVFSAGRMQSPLNPDEFHAASPVQLSPNQIPDLELGDPAAPRVWEILLSSQARLQNDSERKVHAFPLMVFLQTIQQRLGGPFLFLQHGKDNYLRVTSPEVFDDFALSQGRGAKRQLVYHGELAPWEDYASEACADFWPVSLLDSEINLPPYTKAHPWLFGWHDVFHREQNATADNAGQNMALTIVRAALSVLPEIAEWHETAEIFERLAQMDPLESRPIIVNSLILMLRDELLKLSRFRPQLRDRIFYFLDSVERSAEKKPFLQQPSPARP